MVKGEEEGAGIWRILMESGAGEIVTGNRRIPGWWGKRGSVGWHMGVVN